MTNIIDQLLNTSKELSGAITKAQVDSPLFGSQNFADFRQSLLGWIQGRKIRFELDYTIDGAEAQLWAYRVHSESEHIFPLVLIQDSLTEPRIRIYHSTWVLTGGHVYRRPLLSEPFGDTTVPVQLRRYFDSLRSNGIKDMVDCFAPSGYVQEPAGESFRYVGHNALLDAFARMTGGGVATEDVRVIHDENTWALEHNCWSSADPSVPKQAGIAIYRYNDQNELLFAQIVDDYHTEGDWNNS